MSVEVTCLDENALLELMHGALSPERAADVEAHLDGCADCRELAAAVVKVNVAPSSDEEPVATPTLLEPGALVGRYVVNRLIGAGASSVVYGAFDPQLDRQVCLKLLRADVGRLLGDQATRQLVDEAKAMARLSHPNVVIVHDVGTIDGRFFLAMEHVHGGTLQTWLADGPRSWREVVECFVAAGRGLEAAHHAGLVHRDFKPSNVLVGKDGTVRVTDFGLARLLGQPTAARELVGTPAYMSPEQLEGRPADERSDQYSFCVALFEALTGDRPGEKPAFPSKSPVPAAVRAAVLKGLAENPLHRHPTMEALVSALEHRPAQTSRLVVPSVVLSVLVLLGLGLVWRFERQTLAACSAGAERLTGTWDAAQRAKVIQGFEKSGKPYAEATRDATLLALDRAAASWVATYQETCEATWVRRAQSPALLDARMACLEDRRHALRALTTLLADADAVVIEKAVSAAVAFDPSSACSPEAAAKSQAAPRTADEARLHGVLESARARVAAGQYAKAKAEVEVALREARALGLHRTVGDAEVVLARALHKLGDGKAAEDALYRAIAAAERTPDADVLAQAWVDLTFIQGYLLTLTAAAHRSGEVARALVPRAAEHARLEAELENAIASTLRIEGRLEPAEQGYRRALALRRALHGDDDPRTAIAWANLGTTLELRGDLLAALEAHGRALEGLERMLGPLHPDVAIAVNALGVVKESMGDDQEALALYQRTLRIREGAFGSTHPLIARGLNNLCVVEARLGRVKEALEHCEQALPLARAVFGESHATWPTFLNSLGSAQLAAKQLPQAKASFEAALGLRTKVVGPEHPSLGYDEAGLGEVALAGAQSKVAAEHFARALALWRQEPKQRVLQAEASFGLAKALWALEPDRAHAALAEAQSLLEAATPAGRRQLAAVLSYGRAHAK